MSIKKQAAFYLVLLLTVFISSNQTAFAVGSAGFENPSYSAKSLGQANAVVARPQDPSAMTNNPAGLVELSGIQTNIGVQQLDWRIFHRNQATGDHNQNEMKLLLLPTAYVSVNPGKVFDNRVAFGAGINSPFGLSNTFPSIGVGRYTGYKNDLKILATNMAGAIRVTDNWSVGAGAINYWAYDYGQIFNYPNAALLGNPLAADGKALTETSGFGWGWNLGTIFKPIPNHRVAFSYRSRANIAVHGRVVIDDLILGAAQGYDTFPHFETGIHSDIPLPQSFTFAYAYEPSDKWAAEFDFNFTGWSVFKDQDFSFDRPNPTLRALGTIPRNYDSTFNFNWGGHYKLNKAFDLLGGFYFFQAASPKRHVDNFIPDANRYGWTFGTSYQISKRASIDLIYMFALFGSRHISNPGVFAKTRESIDGSYTSILHGAMASFNYQFDFPFGQKVEPPASVAESPTVG